MIDQLIEMIKTNEFAQGALIAAPVTALTYAARNLPIQIWEGMKHIFSYDLMFRSGEEEYMFANKLVTDKVVNSKWSRDFTYDKVQHWSSPSGIVEEKFAGISIGYGRHFGTYNGTPVIVYRWLEENNIGANHKEFLTITFLGLKHDSARAFTKEVTDMIQDRDTTGYVQVFINSADEWKEGPKLTPRPAETVMGPVNDLIDFVNNFSSSKKAFVAKGLPWHTGILLYGPPGGGKTSTIHAIATATDRDIYYLNLSAVADDRELVELITARSDWTNSILVLEDIDATRANIDREKDADAVVSLNTLLNVLDGFMTPSGLLVIATTNHPELLDPALLRAGRFDIQKEIGPLSLLDAKALAATLDPENDLNWDDYVAIVGSRLREEVLKHKNIV